MLNETSPVPNWYYYYYGSARLDNAGERCRWCAWSHTALFFIDAKIKTIAGLSGFHWLRHCSWQMDCTLIGRLPSCNFGNRLSQLDDILKRKVYISLLLSDSFSVKVLVLWLQADAALFSMDRKLSCPDEETAKLDSCKIAERDEKIVKELLKKVKTRRKLVRSYMNFFWFSAFFACSLGNLFIKSVR